MAIIGLYIVIVVVVGFLFSKLASKNVGSYFLAGNRIPWYLLGISNSSSMFDITGTMWLVYLLFAYGLKSAWIPWIWPTFNQIFGMVYLSIWLRRSNVLTGAEWINTRFGKDKGAMLSHLSVVFFALVSVVGFIGYDFKGVGKFAAIFFPWQLSPNTYALIIMAVTTIYVITGGMYSVVLTDALKYVIMVVTSFVVAYIAMNKTTVAQIQAAVPAGWENLGFGWKLNLDWSQLVSSLNGKMAEDGFGFFGIFFMMILFKGVLASIAGPCPNYDMQRVLSTKNPREAALMSWFVSVTQFIPRYMLITGITVLALVYFTPQLNAMGDNVDFEQILPYIINNFLPVGVVGLMLAGLLAAFMSTFDSTVNAGTAYIVVDIYKRYINPNADEKKYVYVSYICTIIVVAVGILFGYMAKSIGSVTMWLVAGLYGGYLAPNVLKWYWWRLNGLGYFSGMAAGVFAALLFPFLFPKLSTINTFPLILVFSGIASIGVSLLTKPEDEETLKKFYTSVRPWGFWKPVYKMVLKDNPSFERNKDFKRDMVNISVGIVWQLSMPLVAIYFVIKNFQSMFITIAVTVVTSVFLHFNWFKKLDSENLKGSEWVSQKTQSAIQEQPILK
ncbi:MAG: sodium:solute symporter [Planctomycetes bacterium GWF2_41_51]|nr:MAG: sodium:solute symporter [Planctomycetes bacterium GWF2_41_51]